MFHFILKFLLRPVFWVYYRRISLSGLENVPATGPAILACNHPNSFLDALLVGTYCPRKIHFLARSDVFRSPFAAWILGQMSMIPVYRLQEGVENLERNQDTFRRCHEILAQGEVVLIFSEGLCIQEMRLRTLKKGTARIALEFSKNGASLKIIPVGNNYPAATEFREEYLLGFGVPFDANEYADLYNENNAKAVTAFNKQLAERLSKVVIDIRDKAHEKEYELLVDMLITEQGPELPTLVSTINDVQERQLNDRTELTGLLKPYLATLRQTNLRDRAVASSQRPNVLRFVYAIGYGTFYLAHFIPAGLSKLVTEKTVKAREFHDSVLLGAAMIFNWLWLLGWTIFWLILNPIVGVAIFTWMLISGVLAVKCYDALTWQQLLVNKAKVPDVANLPGLRKKILGTLNLKSQI